MVNPFRRGAKEHPQLLAHWDSRQELWRFREPAVDEHGEPMPESSPVRADPKTEKLFKQTARIAFGLLRNSRDPNILALSDTLREPCQVWLDLMRNENRGFERVVQIRTEHFSAFLRAKLEGVAEPAHATRVLDDGNILGVFAESATFWDDINARELEAAVRAPEGGSPKPTRANHLERSRDGRQKAARSPEFPNRAVWLKARLEERAWNKHDLSRCGGLEHRTVQRMLNGLKVQDGILEKVAKGLSVHRKAKPVTSSDVPVD